MTRRLYHPDREQIALPAVLDALSDPTRLAVALHLAEVKESACGDYTGWASKTNLSYHLGKLREAGVTRSRIEGTYRLVSLRWDDLNARFPGLLKQILDTARRDPLISDMLKLLDHDVAKGPKSSGPKKTAAAKPAVKRKTTKKRAA